MGFIMKRKKINIAHNLMGCRLDNWLDLLKHNPISKENRPQVLFMTVVIAFLAIPGFFEKLLYDPKIKKTKLKKDPVYIVGFWRSGTTYLQNLLTRDPQFAWFDPVNTVTFNNSILLGDFLSKIMNKLLENARPMDNLDYTMDLPMEEVFAQATISEQAIAHMLVFPDGGKGVKYIETAFIDEQKPKKRREWRKAYDYLLRKITYIKGQKQLILKSPENTCRIGELKRCYPHAKFINIYRDPYAVILSTINMFNKEMSQFCLNKPASPQFIENTAINLFARVYKKAIKELEAMDPKDRVDIRYEDFCKDPKGYVKEIYDRFGIGGYEEALPHFEAYLDSQKNYKKNHFELNDRLRKKINRKLKFYFDYYGYEMIGAAEKAPAKSAQGMQLQTNPN